MIESEEKRQRLTDTITRWAKHTHADRELRNGDIGGLVSSILDEFYHITLSCGHRVREMGDGVSLEYQSQEDGEPCTIYGEYCKDCATQYKKELNAKEVEK